MSPLIFNVGFRTTEKGEIEEVIMVIGNITQFMLRFSQFCGQFSQYQKSVKGKRNCAFVRPKIIDVHLF